MKKSLLIVLTITIMSTFIVISCSNDENDLPTEEDTRYYVKYEVYFKTEHKNVDRIIKYSDESGIHSLTNSEWQFEQSWEGTYGPVKKGFVALLDCSTPYYKYTSKIHAKIYVCREKEPFVIKSEGENTPNSNSLSLSYKIDF